MPDLERITDDLMIHLSEIRDGAVGKAKAKGFVAGKTSARKEVAVCFAVLMLSVLFVVCYIYTTSDANTLGVT